MLTTTLYFILFITTIKKLHPDQDQIEKQNEIDSLSVVYSSKPSRRNILNGVLLSTQQVNKSLFTVSLLLAGDIQLNPGPQVNSVYPCGVCEDPVTWNCRGVACDNCSVWYHGSCMELCTNDFALLDKSNIQWLCHKCESINVDTFTFRSYSLNCSNYYAPIQDPNVTIDSIASSNVFSPLKTSSPTCDNRVPSRNTRSSSNDQAATANEQSYKYPTNQKTKARKLNSSSLYNLPGKNHLRILTINCQRITNKKAELETALNYIKPDIVCGTESWLNQNIKSSEVFPNNYTVYRKDRSRLGGGVFLLVSNDIISSEESDLIADCETVWAKIKLVQNKDLIIGSFYMPHRKEKDVCELDKILTKLANRSKQKHTILCGDFNCPDIIWDKGHVKPGAADRDIQQMVIDTTTNANLVQIHNEATRQKALLDLVFTNNPSLVRTSVTVPGISDHDMVVTDIDTKAFYVKQPKRKCYVFSRANWTGLKDSILEISKTIHKMIKDNKSVEDVWTCFKSDVMKEVDKFIPSKLKGGRSRTPWINSDIKRMLKKKHRLFQQARKTQHWDNYRNFQRECKRAIRKAEYTYVNNIIDEGLRENNTKPFWQYVKSKKQDNIGVAPLKDKCGLVSDSKSKAKILLKQFQSVFTPEDGSPLPTMDSQDYPEIKNITINTLGVLKLLKAINPSKACGPDMLPNLILKDCAEEIAPILSEIFQLSINTGELPTDWKKANISCVYKKGDKHLASNYRPVSLTSVCCKLLEHIICHHLMNHFDSHGILTNLNHGFRSGYSCETQLLTTTNDLLTLYDQGKQIDMAILDFSKAFDTVLQ